MTRCGSLWESEREYTEDILAAPRFQLVSGPDNIREFPEGTAETFLRGDIVLISSGLIEDTLDATAIVGGAKLGVAMADNSASGDMIPVSVFSSDQVWQCYAGAAITPNTLYPGVDYEVSQSAAGTAAMTDGTTTTTVVLYSYKAMGQDGSAAGDPVLVKVEQPSLFEVGL